MSIIDKFTLNSFIKDKIHLIIVFLIALLTFSIPFGHQYGRKIIVVILIFWVFVVKKEDFLKILKHKYILVFLLFIAIHYISLFWSDHVKLGAHTLRVMWIYWFIPTFVFATILQKKDIKFIILGFVSGMFVNEIISYLIYFNLYETAYSKIHHYPVGFLNHITYSVLVAFAAILILYQAKNMKNIYFKSIYIIFFITMTTNLVISSGRTGYVVYFASLIIMLFTYYKVSLKNFLQVLVFPTVIFILGYKMNDGVQARVKASFDAVEKITHSRDYDTSFGTRLAFYPMAYDILNQSNNSFIFGVGIGDIPSEMISSIDRTNLIKAKYTHTHNYYLETYLNTGILGLMLLLLLFYYILAIKIKDREVRFIQQLIVINIMIAILSDRILDITPTMFFFAFFTSIVLAQERFESLKEIKDD